MGVDAMGTTPKMLAVWASNGMTRTTRSTRNQALAMAAPSTASVAKNAPFDYVALYKPALMLTSLHDDEARSQRKHRPPRPTLLDLDNKLSERIHPINTTMLSYHVAGRLDRDSEGLLLLTNDGTFTATVCGSLHCHKRYWVGTRDRLTESQLDRLRHDGLVIRGRPTRPPISVQRLNATAAHTWLTNHNNEESTGQYGRAARHWLEIVLNQGRNRQIRRMTTAVGHRTVRLVRVGIGNLHLFPTIHNNNHDDDNDAEVALDPTMTCLQLQPGEWQQIGANDVLGPPCKRPPL